MSSSSTPNVGTPSESKFHMNIKVDRQYATWRRENHKSLKDPTEANRLRMEGKKHIDLWVDGNLYPIDPSTGRCPPFSSVHDLIRFVGDGANGLLGYCLKLNSFSSDYVYQFNLIISNYQNQIRALQRTIHSFEISNKSLQNKIHRLKNTPLGMRERARSMKHICNLREKCGARKKRMRLTRQCVSHISGLDMHKVDDRVQLLNETMNQTDIVNVLRAPKNAPLRKIAQRELLGDFNSMIDPSNVVETCDKVGVSRKGYWALSGLWFKHLKQKRVKPFGLPRPYNFMKARSQLNLQIPICFGDYFHIEGSMPFEKQHKRSIFEYTIFNNIWMDLKRVQIAMVKLYKISIDECHGHLIFVLKLDEAQIQKNQKMERVSISLMNHALEYS